MSFNKLNKLIEDSQSIKIHDTLNSSIWDTENTLKPEVLSHLLTISEMFLEYLDIDWVNIDDIVFTGSLANYNYTKYSDIDLHIIISYDDIHKNCPIVPDFLDAKKSLFNKKHDITIKGYPVELYVEDLKHPAKSSGVFSIVHDEWVVKPLRKPITYNDKAVTVKLKEFTDKIKNIIDSGTLEEGKELLEKIYLKRKAGLEKSGEFSVENIVFKLLRNENLIQKLKDDIDFKTDEMLSLP